MGSTTRLLAASPDSPRESPPRPKATSRSSLTTPRRTSRGQTRRVVVSPKPPDSPESGVGVGQQLSYVNQSGTTEIVVMPRKTS